MTKQTSDPDLEANSADPDRCLVLRHKIHVMRKPTFWFPTWSDTNRAVQPQKTARGLKFRIWKIEGLYYVAKIKALISFAVTAKLICVFVFAYAKHWFSHDAAQLKQRSDRSTLSTSVPNPDPNGW